MKKDNQLQSQQSLNEQQLETLQNLLLQFAQEQIDSEDYPENLKHEIPFHDEGMQIEFHTKAKDNSKSAYYREAIKFLAGLIDYDAQLIEKQQS